MEQPFGHKEFIFNEKINSSCLVDLYEHDFVYMAQVFGISEESFETDLPPLHAAYAGSDIDALRKAVHKLKPVFGFTGLLAHQQAMAAFEAQCMAGMEPAHMRTAYRQLLDVIEDGRRIISEEAKRLNSFVG